MKVGKGDFHGFKKKTKLVKLWSCLQRQHVKKVYIFVGTTCNITHAL